MTEFEKLFRENHDMIFKYLIKLTKDISLAEELTSETFYRAYMNYSGLRDKSKANVWLCKIAKNVFYSKISEQKKTQSFDYDKLPNEHDSIENIIIKKELSCEIARILDDLDEPYKQVFRLNVLEGMTLKDISGIFGKSESWARVTFYRAKKKIIDKMR